MVYSYSSFSMYFWLAFLYYYYDFHMTTDSVHLGRMARSKCIEFQNGNADKTEDNSGYGIF